jgi:hypothetical protein
MATALGFLGAGIGALLSSALLVPTPLFGQTPMDHSLQVPFIPGRVHVESGIALSADGRRLAFAAGPNPSGSERAVLVFDRELELRVASLDADGQPLPAAELPALSADGRTLAFRGQSGGPDSDWDLYVRDLASGSTRVLRARELAKALSDESASVGAPRARYDYPQRSLAINADGTILAFEWTARSASTGAERHRLLLHDLSSGRTERLDVGPAPHRAAGNAHSRGPLLSADGRFVAFSSLASNLVQGDDNGSWDAFVRDRRTGTTRLESVTAAGAALPSSGLDGGAFATGLTPDGRFLSLIANRDLVSGQPLAAALQPRSLFVRDRDRALSQHAFPPGRATGNCEAELPASGIHGGLLSADGRLVAFQTCQYIPILGNVRTAFHSFFDRHTGQLTFRGGAFLRLDAVAGALSYDGRVAGSLGQATDVEPGVFLGVNEVFPVPAAEAFAVFRKGGAEWVVSLGDPGALPAQGIALDSQQLPKRFGGTLRGAEFLVVGVLHESHYVRATLRPNLLFSGREAEDPSVLDDSALSAAYERLAAGSDAWLDHWRRRLPHRGTAAAVLVHDEDSAASRLGGDDFGGAFPFSIAIRLRERQTRLPVYGALASAPDHPDAFQAKRSFGVSYSLRVDLSGRITGE